jgi:hypothetical protein
VSSAQGRDGAGADPMAEAAANPIDASAAQVRKLMGQQGQGLVVGVNHQEHRGVLHSNPAPVWLSPSLLQDGQSTE